MQVSVNKERDKYIGGSDIPIIMGISRFKTRFDLLLEKANLKEDNFDGNEYTEYGNIMEEKIRYFINEYYNHKFVEGMHIKEDIRCHTDGEEEDCILEIKTTSQIKKDLQDYKVYLVQLLFYMQETGKNNGILAVYERPKSFDEDFDERRLDIYKININEYEDLLKEINESVELFKKDLEKIKRNPFMTEEDLVPLNISDLAGQIINLENKLIEFKKIEEKQKELKKVLTQQMSEKNISSWTMPNGTKITLVKEGKDKEVDEFNEEKFKKENEEIYNQYLEKVIKKGRAGYVKITPASEENE